MTGRAAAGPGRRRLAAGSDSESGCRGWPPGPGARHWAGHCGPLQTGPAARSRGRASIMFRDSSIKLETEWTRKKGPARARELDSPGSRRCRRGGIRLETAGAAAAAASDRGRSRQVR